MNQIVKPPVALAEPESGILLRRSLYRLTVDQYLSMGAGEIIPPDVRTELLDGYVVNKMTPNPPHATAVTLVSDQVREPLPREWLIRAQLPLVLKGSVPEPDIAVVRGPARRYVARHPGPRDAGLIIEVSDTSLLSDRLDKGPLYAQAKLPVYWIVNLIEEVIEVYTSPRAGKQPGYLERQDYGKDAKVPLIIAGQEFGRLAVKDLLP